MGNVICPDCILLYSYMTDMLLAQIKMNKEIDPFSGEETKHFSVEYIDNDKEFIVICENGEPIEEKLSLEPMYSTAGDMWASWDRPIVFLNRKPIEGIISISPNRVISMNTSFKVRFGKELVGVVNIVLENGDEYIFIHKLVYGYEVAKYENLSKCLENTLFTRELVKLRKMTALDVFNVFKLEDE